MSYSIQYNTVKKQHKLHFIRLVLMWAMFFILFLYITMQYWPSGAYILKRITHFLLEQFEFILDLSI